MAITDAQFTHWLHKQTARVVLCEIDYAYESAGAPATGTIYLSDRGYRTSGSDTPAHVNYRSAIRSIPKLRRGLDRKTLGGRAELSVSDLDIDNADGELDGLLTAILDGREARFYVGAPASIDGVPTGWTRADFRLAFVAVAERVTAPDESRIVVKLRDKRLLLDREVIGNQVGGTGAEKDQFSPLLFGACYNLDARIYDVATAKYAVLSNYSGARVSDVRDAGQSLTATPVQIQDPAGGAVNITANAGTDTLMRTAHGLVVNDVLVFEQQNAFGYSTFAPFAGLTAGVQYWVIAAGLTADDFRLSLTKGGSAVDITGTSYLGTWAGPGYNAVIRRRRYYDDVTNTGRIQLSSSATGRVTVDALGATSYTLDPFGFMEDLILAYGNVSASEIESAGFGLAASALDDKILLGYFGRVVRARENLIETLDAVCRSCFGWYGSTRAGKITAGVMDVSGIASATATRTLGRGDIVPASGIQVENDPVRFGRISVNFSRNETVQADGLTASVSEDDRRRLANPFVEVQRSDAPSGTAYATDPASYHKTMVEADPVAFETMSSYFGYPGSGPVPILGEAANELVADSAPHRQFITAACGIEQYDAEIGDVVLLTYPRYGMDDGVNARIFGVTLDLTAWRVDLEMVRQVAPSLSQEVLP